MTDSLSLSAISSQTIEVAFVSPFFFRGVILQSFHQAGETTIDSASFAVRDGTLPEVSILSPASRSYLNSTFNLAVVARDSGSGIDRVEYQMDGGSWGLLPVSDPSQGRYSMEWVPGHSDEGLRTLRFRATDRSGNASSTVSTVFTIDITPPALPVIKSPPDRSSVTSTTVDIRRIAERESTVEMVSGAVFRTEADPITGEFVFKGVGLIPGNNVFLFTATDRAGNVSGTTTHTLILSSTSGPTVRINLGKGEYLPNEVVTITSVIQNTSGKDSLEGLIGRVSVLGSQGEVLFSQESPIPALGPGQTFQYQAGWNTASSPKGRYTARLEVVKAGVRLAEATAVFDIIYPNLYPVPTLDHPGLMILGLLVAAGGLAVLYRRSLS